MCACRGRLAFLHTRLLAVLCRLTAWLAHTVPGFLGGVGGWWRGGAEGHGHHGELENHPAHSTSPRKQLSAARSAQLILEGPQCHPPSWDHHEWWVQGTANRLSPGGLCPPTPSFCGSCDGGCCLVRFSRGPRSHDVHCTLLPPSPGHEDKAAWSKSGGDPGQQDAGGTRPPHASEETPKALWGDK